MWGRLITFFVGILGLVGAGALSYVYLEYTMGPREAAIVETSTKPATSVTQKTATPESADSRLDAVKTNGSLIPKAATTEKKVVTPGPLRATTQVKSGTTLSIQGIIENTNKERAINGGLPALTENVLLNQDAQIKLSDMFTKQYFEHVSPTGTGPSDLAQVVGYAYVIVGENLALGDFAGDVGVVTAWMNSPGHRANILNTHFQEIGVAVGKGMYEGRETWLAVQAFGMPTSACPVIDAKLKAKIAENNATIATLKSGLDAKKAQIDATSTSDPNYNTYVNEFNALIPQYNNLVETNRFNVTTYNGGVQAFNACIAAAGATEAGVR